MALSMGDNFAPTPYLRWYTETVKEGRKTTLQQWWAPNVPAHMAVPGVGDWRDVEGVIEPEVKSGR